MPNCGKQKRYYPKPAFLLILGIMILAPVAISNNAFAQTQTLHNRTLSEVGRQTSELDENAQIDVGGSPYGISVNEAKDTVYVVKYSSDNISVISGENNRKIGEDIPVGDGPTSIAVNELTNRGYVTNFYNASVSVIDLENNRKIGEDIPVGDGPTSIAVNEDTDTVYVTNFYNASVSIINGTTNRKIGEDIPVGDGPTSIAVNELTNRGYVTNFYNASVSVIDLENNRKIGEDIPVGDGPTSIAVNELTNGTYVANYWSNTVSRFIVGGIFEFRHDIPVGDNPEDIAVNEDTDTVYVTNRHSNSISVINPVTSEVVAGVTFYVNPFNSGYIVCDVLNGLFSNVPIEQYVYVDSGTKCTATPNEGFEFLSWVENLDGNSTQLINVSRPTSQSDSFLEFLRIKSPDEHVATLNITKFGTFTANFKEAPPPVPPEFWAQMYVVVGTVVTALFIPSIVGWFKSKRDSNKLNYFHKRISSLYQDGKLDENDIEGLNQLRSRVVDAYSEGKINEKHYESLRTEISTLYEEIFRKKINALNSSDGTPSKKTTQEQLAEIRNEIKYAFSKGKINDKHYALLNEDISKLDGKESSNTS